MQAIAMIRTPVSLLVRLKDPANEEAWNEFVDLYGPLVYGWMVRQGLPAADAADCVQETLVRLLRTLPTFEYDRKRSFRAWLKVVAVSALQDFYRRSGRLKAADALAATPSYVEDPADEFHEHEYRRYLLHRVMELVRREFQPTTWAAFHEVVIAQKPAAEVAAELDLTVNAVYLARSRVLRKMRERLEDLWD